MWFETRYMAPILVAAGALAGMVAAPMAAAAVVSPPTAVTHEVCVTPGLGIRQCSTPGNTSISVRHNPNIHPPVRYAYPFQR